MSKITARPAQEADFAALTALYEEFYAFQRSEGLTCSPAHLAYYSLLPWLYPSPLV